MNIYVMVGNIGSGKTNWVKRFLASHVNTVVVSRDDLRYMVGAGNYVFDPELEPVIFNSARDMIENIMENGNFDILVDEVNVSVNYRKDYLDLANQYHYCPVAIVMPKIGKKKSVDRRMQNPHGQLDRSIWEGVFDKFDALYEEPIEKEGFLRIYKPKGIKLDENTSLQDLLTGN